MPAAWPDAVFHSLRAEGAFLVSAKRTAGKTNWVRIKSLDGEPCRVASSLAGEVRANVPLKAISNGRYELTLAPTITPIANPAGVAFENYFNAHGNGGDE